jgi:hypothetical protein
MPGPEYSGGRYRYVATFAPWDSVDLLDDDFLS